MGAILFLLWSTPRDVAGGGLLALLLFLLQRGLDLFADIHGDLQDLALAAMAEWEPALEALLPTRKQRM